MMPATHESRPALIDDDPFLRDGRYFWPRPLFEEGVLTMILLYCSIPLMWNERELFRTFIAFAPYVHHLIAILPGFFLSFSFLLRCFSSFHPPCSPHDYIQQLAQF